MSGKRYCFGGRIIDERLRDVWQLMASSETAKGIALKLKLSPKTVEYHRSRLFNTLGIHDVAGITREAIKTGVIKL